MADLCSRLQQQMSATAADSGTADPELMNHLDECDECRRQWSAELALRDAFTGMARPVLSPHFDQELALALAEERRRQRKRRLRLRLMQTYWLIAGAACSYILAHLPWSETSTLAAWLPMLILVAVSAMLPVVLVPQACRVDLMDLILGTCDDQLSQRAKAGEARLGPSRAC